MAKLEQSELSRKYIHLLALLIPVIAYYSVLSAQLLLVFAALFYWYAEREKIRGKRHFFTRVISFVQRPEEKNIFARAPLFLALGVFGAITFFSWKAALLGIFQVAFCDSMAALCGKKWGVEKLPLSDRKTYVGVAAYFISALPIAFYFLLPAQAVTLAMLGAFLEAIPVKDWDNFTIPLVISFIAENFLYGMG